MRLADTNVLVYAVSNRGEDARKRARAIAVLKEPALALSVQVLQEFYHQAVYSEDRSDQEDYDGLRAINPFTDTRG